MQQNGNIGVTTENIFPVIKQFLYSDREIFLREIISNAVDATQKLATLASIGQYNGSAEGLKVEVSLGKDYIKVSDKGIGMTGEEVDKYINQIAFSGANDFLEKYRDSAKAIIGHFGLGFYSAFMVAKKVEIITLSCKEGEKAVKWTCDGSPAFTMEDTEKDGHGTDVIIYVDDDSREFLDELRIGDLLRKYCRFLPVPIAFGKKKEWKDGKQVETDEDNIINDTTPLWTRKPSELKDEDYKKFYSDLYPMDDEPLFWIHLNVDYPFHLTGVLYFPRVKSNLDLTRHKIQLFCNQVFVTDEVEGIVPDFLCLLHGVIDSPDIPLNVSRSYLQSDSNVKKIAGYITKKVADRLQSIFKTDRKQLEEKWEDLKLFIHYGMLSDEPFYDRAKDFALLTDCEGKHFTYEEYKKLIEGTQTDKDNCLIYLYATDRDEQFSQVEAAKQKGYSVLMMNGQLEVPMMNMLEQKSEGKVRFTRVDSDTIDALIRKETDDTTTSDGRKSDILTGMFNSLLPKMDKVELMVTVANLGPDADPVVLTRSEYMRRMKDLSKVQSGMSFYQDLPDTFRLTLNAENAIVSDIANKAATELAEKIDSLEASIGQADKELAELRKQLDDKKEEDKSTEEKDRLEEAQQKLDKLKDDKQALLADHAKGNEKISQLIDLALLQNGLLRGAALNDFVKRSWRLI